MKAEAKEQQIQSPLRSRGSEARKVLEGLNKEQLKAVTFGSGPASPDFVRFASRGGPLLIIAGAGTGKTTVLTRRIAWLIEQKFAKPEEILALTFTEKAAEEMSDRVDKFMPLSYGDTQISTFHAFAQEILKQHALDIGLPGDFKILTDTKLWILIKNHIYDFKLNYYKPIGNPNKFIHSLLKHFQKLKGEGITPDDYLQYAQGLKLNQDSQDGISSEEIMRINEVANAYHVYQKLLLDNSHLDFGDLINYTLQLFAKRPKILKEYQAKHKFILVDEFQDTDLAQYEMVKMLAQPENNITVVGDDDQSIYKFRGASVSNILKFKKDFPKSTEIALTDNYRSAQKILDLAYGFIQQNNPERLESKLKISKKLKSNHENEFEIKVLHSRTVFEEARSVADKIEELLSKGLSLNDCVILVRANDHAESFISELSKRGLPYIFWANRGLYKKPFILDIMAYLKLVDDYQENENVYRVLNIPKFEISDDYFVTIAQIAKRKALNIYEILKDSRSHFNLKQDVHQKIDQLTALVTKHTVLARSSPISEVLIKVLQDLDLIKNLTDDSYESQEKRDLLEQFYKKTLRFEEENEDKSVKNFLNQIKLELEAGDLGELQFNQEAGPEAIKIMTIHTAKGLEFTAVFVVNMVDQRFPSRDRKDQIEVPKELIKEILSEGDVNLMEERRLFYVAMTRAKQYLYMAWSDDYGGVTNKKPSRFLVELGLEEPPIKSEPIGKVFFTEQKPLFAVKSKLRVPDTFSFSQISCFLRCPLEYKYRYVYHLPLPGEAQLSFGQTIHKTLEKYLLHVVQLNSGQKTDLFGKMKPGLELPGKDILKKYYQEAWVDDWFRDKSQKEEYKKIGRNLLDNFYEIYSKNPKLPKYLEKVFKLKLGKYKFVGKIDRADYSDGNALEIVDYKTGAERAKLDPVDKQQLLVYQWAAEEEFKDKVKSLRYWYLTSTNESIEFLGTKEEINEVKNRFLEVIERIVSATKESNFYNEDLRAKSHNCKFRDLERKR